MCRHACMHACVVMLADLSRQCKSSYDSQQTKLMTHVNCSFCVFLSVVVSFTLSTVSVFMHLCLVVYSGVVYSGVDILRSVK